MTAQSYLESQSAGRLGNILEGDPNCMLQYDSVRVGRREAHLPSIAAQTHHTSLVSCSTIHDTVSNHTQGKAEAATASSAPSSKINAGQCAKYPTWKESGLRQAKQRQQKKGISTSEYVHVQVIHVHTCTTSKYCQIAIHQ